MKLTRLLFLIATGLFVLLVTLSQWRGVRGHMGRLTFWTSAPVLVIGICPESAWWLESNDESSNRIGYLSRPYRESFNMGAGMYLVVPWIWVGMVLAVGWGGYWIMAWRRRRRGDKRKGFPV